VHGRACWRRRGALLGGLAPRQAFAVGFGMNAQGAIGIVLAAFALDAGVIDDRIFVAIVVVALVTSLMSGPIITRLTRERLRRIVTTGREVSEAPPLAIRAPAEQRPPDRWQTTRGHWDLPCSACCLTAESTFYSAVSLTQSSVIG
jgi:hypothetical protein